MGSISKAGREVGERSRRVELAAGRTRSCVGLLREESGEGCSRQSRSVYTGTGSMSGDHRQKGWDEKGERFPSGMRWACWGQGLRYAKAGQCYRKVSSRD